MDSQKKSEASASKNESRLLLSEQKDIVGASAYASTYITKMEELEDKFDKMGWLRLIWDSKVPEENKWFLKRFSFKCSDKEEVIREIRKYLEFYEAMHAAMEKLRGNKEKSDKESDDPCIIISDLNELLTNMDKVAQSDLGTTSSSAVFKLHKEFIAKHTQLENMVKRVECVVSRDRIKTLTTLLDSCQTTIQVFQNGLQDFQRLKIGMEEQIRELVAENEKQRQQQQSLIAVNAKLREDQNNLLSQYNNTYNRMENVEKMLSKLADKKEDKKKDEK